MSVQERSPLGCLLALAGLPLCLLGVVGLYYGWRGHGHEDAAVRALATRVLWSSGGGLALGLLLLVLSRVAFRAGLTFRNRVDSSGVGGGF